MAKERRGKRKKGTTGFNRKNSETFLLKNRAKPEVIVLDSGLQYTIVDRGSGPQPGADDTVMVHQRISLIDGTLLDDTYKKNEPAVFTMKEAIEGYREGLFFMPQGSRFKFFIPPHLAWGKRGAGSKIGSESVLIIDCRLLEIF